MAAKENDRSKTSKTARVMNLLSKKQEPAPTADEASEIPAAGGTGEAPVPPIISSLAPDAAVSVQIKTALEDALQEELKGPSPASQAQGAAPAPQAAPVQSAEAPALAAPQSPAASAQPEAAPAPSAPPVPVQLEEFSEPEQESAPAGSPIPAQPIPTPPLSLTVVPPPAPSQSGYINVMQVLVEEKAEKYAKMFGLCTCSRCMDDVKALALNHLPPKYVVMDEGDRIPKLTFYEGHYSSDITAQLLHACETVHRRPHHTR